MARRWRLFHPEIPARAGEELRLTTEEARHARRVLCLREGEAVSVFDGRGVEWEGEVRSIEGDEVRIVLAQPAARTLDPSIRLELHQGLCRADRMEWIVQKCTELGLAVLHVHPTRRGDLKDVGSKRLERWRRIAVEAAKQSGRSVIPEIVEAGPGLPAADDGVPSWIALLQPGAPGLGLACAEAGTTERARIAVGPESGFDPQEVESALSLGWQAVELGPRTLRAETAAVVATALILAFLGEMGSPPPR